MEAAQLELGTMEEIPVHGLEELERHVQQLAEAPETPLNAKLFDEVELQLNGKFFHFSAHLGWVYSGRCLGKERQSCCHQGDFLFEDSLEEEV
jgi:hypothetical protein